MRQFKFSVPLEILSKDDNGWKIRGVASTEDKDLQGEIVKQNGLDFSYIKKGLGLFNWNHKNDPQNILGKIEDMYTKEDKTFVEGYLFEHQDNAKAIVNIMKSLKEGDKNRVQMSIEGEVVDRDKKNNKIIKNAIVKKVALTLDAVNPNTYADLVKSLVAEDASQSSSELPPSEDGYIAVTGDLVEKSEHKEDVPTDNSDLVKSLIGGIDKLLKALTAGHAYEGAPGAMSGGSAITSESLDGDLKDVKVKKKKKKKEEEVLEEKELTKKSLYESNRNLFKSIFAKLKCLHPVLSLDKISQMTETLFFDSLEKAMGHKYIKRTGVPGNYKYWYKDEKTGKLVEGKNPEEAGAKAPAKQVEGSSGKGLHHIKPEVQKQLADAAKTTMDNKELSEKDREAAKKVYEGLKGRDEQIVPKTKDQFGNVDKESKYYKEARSHFRKEAPPGWDEEQKKKRERDELFGRGEGKILTWEESIGRSVELFASTLMWEDLGAKSRLKGELDASDPTWAKTIDRVAILYKQGESLGTISQMTQNASIKNLGKIFDFLEIEAPDEKSRKYFGMDEKKEK